MPCPKTTRVVSSIEFCQSIFDKGDIGRGLGGGGVVNGHNKFPCAYSLSQGIEKTAREHSAPIDEIQERFYNLRVEV